MAVENEQFKQDVRNENNTVMEEAQKMPDEKLENQRNQEGAQPAEAPPTRQEPQKPSVIQTQTGGAAPQGKPAGTKLTDFASPNLDLMMNVPMQLSVEIGRTKKTLREILELGKDSLVVLDKAAGDTVDLYVNGSHVAKGEVVVVDEHFGIRISEIVSNTEMLDKL